MPGNAARTEGMASRTTTSKRARTASVTTARHLAIFALHVPERACGPDQVLPRKTRHNYESLASYHIEVPLLPDRAPPGVIGPLHLRGFVLQLGVHIYVRLPYEEAVPVLGGDRARAISRDAAHRQPGFLASGHGAWLEGIRAGEFGGLFPPAYALLSGQVGVGGKRVFGGCGRKH